MTYRVFVYLFIVTIAWPWISLGEDTNISPKLEFVRKGKPIKLSTNTTARVVQQLETIGRTCVLNSRQHNHLKPHDDLKTLRNNILSDSYLRITYTNPISLRPDIELTELIQATPDGDFVGHLLTKNGPEVIAYAKCGGLETLQLMCLKGLAEHFPKTYGRNCNVVEKAIADGQLRNGSE